MSTKLSVFAGRVIFDHLPKTAGSAINTWLNKELGSGCISPNKIGEHQELIRNFGGDYPIISAHVGFKGTGLDPRYQYITCMREPIDRAISWLYFVNTNYKAEMLPDLWQHVDRFICTEGQEIHPVLLGHISNPYVEHFSSVMTSASCDDEHKLVNALKVIDQYDVWGLYEELPEFLSAVAAMIGIPSPKRIEKVNTTNSRPATKEISSKLRSVLQELNDLDMEFYRVVSQRWLSQRRKKNLTVKAESQSKKYVAYNPEWERKFSVAEFSLQSVNLENGNEFVTGQLLTFSINFSLRHSVDELVIGIGFIDEYGRWAFGTNTELLKSPILKVNEGTYEVNYSITANLTEGQYAVSCAFVEHGLEGDHELAWYDNVQMFKITGSRVTPSIGYADLPTKLSFRQLSNEASELIRADGTIRIDTTQKNVGGSEHFDLHIWMKNASNQIWINNEFNPINLSYHWIDRLGNTVIFDGERTSLPVKEIRVGQEIEATMKILPPTAAGCYKLLVLPVQEGRCWFDERGFTPGVLEVTVQ